MAKWRSQSSRQVTDSSSGSFSLRQMKSKSGKVYWSGRIRIGDETIWINVSDRTYTPTKSSKFNGVPSKAAFFNARKYSGSSWS